jgi:hypothetical protein
LAVERARELQSVPASLWDDVAGKGADLRAVRNLYRDNIRGHIAQLGAKGSQAKGEYLHQNAEEIVLDSTALLSSLKAWTGYQALHAGKARTAGREDPDEVRLVDIIARDTRRELSASLDEVRETGGCAHAGAQNRSRASWASLRDTDFVFVAWARRVEGISKHLRPAT